MNIKYNDGCDQYNIGMRASSSLPTCTHDRRIVLLRRASRTIHMPTSVMTLMYERERTADVQRIERSKVLQKDNNAQSG